MTQSTSSDINEIGKYLSVVNYPAGKESILRDIEKVGADPATIIALQMLPELQYHTPREVMSQIQ